MGKKRTAANIIKVDVDFNLSNGDHTEKIREKKKKKEERREREVKVESAAKSRPDIEAKVANGDSEVQKTKSKKIEGSKDAFADELPTVSIALPGSIIDNAQSLELATLLAGQIARAATIFRIDEVVVFDNVGNCQDSSGVLLEDNLDENESGAAFLLMILRVHYPHLTPHIICGSTNGLLFEKTASLMPGVTLRDQHPNLGGTLVDVGLNKHILIDQVIDPGKRITVSMETDRNLDSDVPHRVVSTSTPREDAGIYWGYKVRYASNISSVFKSCPYKGGYDYLIGTSEHGITIKSSELSLPSFRHLLIAFGGLAGLEECIEEDTTLKGKNVRDVFDIYLNTCPHQGSRTIRTEEAVLVSLQYFQEPINRILRKS